MKMLPHDSGEAGEQSETEGGAMQGIALILRIITPFFKGGCHEVTGGFFKTLPSITKLSPKTCSEPKTILLSLLLSSHLFSLI